MTNTIRHWINNKPYPGASDATAAVTNPATGAVTGEVALASVADARALIDAAAAAFPAWRDTSLAKRSAILFKFREQSVNHRHRNLLYSPPTASAAVRTRACSAAQPDPRRDR